MNGKGKSQNDPGKARNIDPATGIPTFPPYDSANAADPLADHIIGSLVPVYNVQHKSTRSTLDAAEVQVEATRIHKQQLQRHRVIRGRAGGKHTYSTPQSKKGQCRRKCFIKSFRNNRR